MRTARDDIQHVILKPSEIAALKAKGHDGIIYNDGEEIIVFEPTQIKSAIGNRGTYDPDDPDIRKARGGLAVKRKK